MMVKWNVGLLAVMVACGCGVSADDAAGSLRKRAVKQTPMPAKKELVKKLPNKNIKPIRRDRATVLRAVKGLGNLDQVRVPVFRDSVKRGERAELVARLDKAFAEMKKDKGTPREVLDGVRVWESLDQEQRVGLLSGNYGEVAAIPTWAVAAVGAAHLTYEVGKDYNWWASAREKFTLEQFKSRDLDYVESKLGIAAQKELSQKEVLSAIKSVGSLKGAKVPVFKDSIQGTQQAKIVARLDKAFNDMKRDSKVLPGRVQEGVRIWESLDAKQRGQMLGGEFGTVAAVPSWAVAAVGAAALVYEVGKDHNWWGSSREALDMVAISAKDLDYVQKAMKTPANMPSHFQVHNTLQSMGKLEAAKVPVFKDSLKAGQRKELVTRLDQAFKDMRNDVSTLPPDIQHGVMIWESLEATQREQMLGGKLGQVAAVPTWAVAAVGAAKLVYDVGKDYNWWGSSREQLDVRAISAKELDYINPGMR